MVLLALCGWAVIAVVVAALFGGLCAMSSEHEKLARKVDRLNTGVQCLDEDLVNDAIALERRVAALERQRHDTYSTN
jgi:hypothetical protein